MNYKKNIHLGEAVTFYAEGQNVTVCRGIDGVAYIEDWGGVSPVSDSTLERIWTERKALSSACNEIERLESLITPRRLRERDMGIEQYVDPDNGGDLAEVDGGMPYIKWVYSKIVEQQTVIRQSK